MPAKSKAQQKFMGMVLAAKRGQLKNPSSAVKKAAGSMSAKSAKDFASTKRSKLPKNVKKSPTRSELLKKMKTKKFAKAITS